MDSIQRIPQRRRFYKLCKSHPSQHHTHAYTYTAPTYKKDAKKRNKEKHTPARSLPRRYPE